MNDFNFEEAGKRWEDLNEEYDSLIQDFINNPKQEFSPEKIVNMKQMQKELFELEEKIFEVIESRIN